MIASAGAFLIFAVLVNNTFGHQGLRRISGVNQQQLSALQPQAKVKVEILWVVF